MTSNDLLEPLHQRRLRVSKIADQLRALQSARQNLEYAIDSYGAFVPELEKDKIERLGNTAANLARKIADLETNQQILERRLRDINSAKVNPLLFWKLFSAEQRQLRADTAKLGGELSETMTRIANDQKAISKTRDDASTARKRLSEHESFNLKEAETRRSSLGLEARAD